MGIEVSQKVVGGRGVDSDGDGGPDSALAQLGEPTRGEAERARFLAAVERDVVRDLGEQFVPEREEGCGGGGVICNSGAPSVVLRWRLSDLTLPGRA